MRIPASILLLLASACISIPAPEVGYYDGATGDPPHIDQLSDNDQAGNVSGKIITISGSGFGDEADEVMVQFGQHNAEVLDASDGTLSVRVPAGPVGGGDVTLSVGTVNGKAAVTYEYAMNDAVVALDGEGHQNEVGYVVVNNYWESCLGGLSSRLEDEWGASVSDCSTFAYIGNSGLDASAEALEISYARLHAGYQGFEGGADLSGSWAVETPAEAPYAAGIEDYHRSLGSVRIKNDFWADQNTCVGLANTATYRFGGGEVGFENPVTIYGSGLAANGDPSPDDECDGDTELYALDELNLCDRDTSDGLPGYYYKADWPINQNFFQSSSGGRDPVTVSIDMPDIGISGVEVTLPEPIVVYNTEGYKPVFDDATLAAQDLWGAFSAPGRCFDDGDDGEQLDDVAMAFQWRVSDLDNTALSKDERAYEYPEVGKNGVLGVRTYVRMTMTTLTLGWFGGVSFPVRATITVPDENDPVEVELDRRKTEMRSVLQVPASVMYQIPTVKIPSAGGGAVGGGGPADSTYVYPNDSDGYFIVEIQRVTEYTLDSDIGPVVFAYVTGDFGFSEWTNPLDGPCTDCTDNDDDGWLDEFDPDCRTGTDESASSGTDACNDGRDNDGDGLVDSADADCENGYDDDESNCDNNTDDDLDGYKDADDADCVRGDYEHTADGCLDGADNDADGWSDANDPDCTAGTEETGVGDGGCNNGDDDDGDGWTDAGDPDCFTAASAESGFGTTECNDAADNDGDLSTDGDDPDCVDAHDVSEAP